MPPTTMPHAAHRPGSPATQHGVMLLEAMIAILIFSLGVLSIIQLQAVSIKQSSDAQYRSTAALLANDLIGRMWTSDKSLAALQGMYGSDGGGDGYKQWLDAVKESGLPNVNDTNLQTVPEVKITIGDVNNGNAPKVSVKLFWQAPGKKEEKHFYTAVAELK